MRTDKLNSNSSLRNTKQRSVARIDNTAARAVTLKDSQSGTMFICNLATVDNNITLTLPTASGSEGVWFDFVVNVASDDDADLIITTGLDATNIYGTVDTLAAISTNLVVNGNSKITLDGSVAQSVGIKLNLLCDGVHWHLSGHVPNAVGSPHVTSAADA